MRPDHDLYFLLIARTVALRSTCISRSVGCVLTNRDHNILSTGYNGNASGVPNCIDTQCKRPNAESGKDLHLCEALHAEMNSLLQCHDVREIDTAYVTSSPCLTCVKLLMNTPCRRIMFLDEYPNNPSEPLWTQIGREWVHYKPSITQGTVLFGLSQLHKELRRT